MLAKSEAVVKYMAKILGNSWCYRIMNDDPFIILPYYCNFYSTLVTRVCK